MLYPLVGLGTNLRPDFMLWGSARPSFKAEKVSGENKEVATWVKKYLDVGEWVMDQSVAIAGSSGWFERTR